LPAGALSELDRDAFTWVVEHRVGWLDPVFVALSAVGYAGLVWIGLAVVVALATKRSLLLVVPLTAVCVWGADLLTLGLKAATDRARPFDAVADPEPLLTGTLGSSLPSGHAATSAAGAVVLAAFAPRAAAAFALLALGVAFSRIYVGVHYPADVLLGAAIGAAVALVVLRLRRPLRLEGSPPRRSRSPTGG
jgi:membrane-associated phospholipid phosphatase